MNKYPLIEYAADTLRAASGRSLDDVTLETVETGELELADVQISGATLRAQADIAQQAGYTGLAENLVRAAELTAVPNDELLHMYDALRPGRATYDELIALSTRLEAQYYAPENARLVRAAAEAYLARGLVRRG
jgi:propanediol dehydratase small subunit